MMLALLGSLTALIFVLFGGTIGLLCLALWIWMLVDCLTNDGIPGSEKVAWVLVIFLLPLIVWFGFNAGVSGLSQLLFNQRPHISQPVILLVCAVFLVLLFVGNARTSRDYLNSLPRRNYVPSASMPGGVFGALGNLLAYPGA